MAHLGGTTGVCVEFAGLTQFPPRVPSGGPEETSVELRGRLFFFVVHKINRPSPTTRLSWFLGRIWPQRLFLLLGKWPLCLPPVVIPRLGLGLIPLPCLGVSRFRLEEDQSALEGQASPEKASVLVSGRGPGDSRPPCSSPLPVLSAPQKTSSRTTRLRQEMHTCND